MLVIHCPACAAGLQLPHSALARRARRICCTVCEHRWVEAAIIVESAPTNPQSAESPEISLMAQSVRSETEEDSTKPSIGAKHVEEAPGAAARSIRTAPKERRSWPVKLAACAAMALALLSVMKREAVVRAAPPLAGVYAAIGLPVNLKGLEWRDVKTRVVGEAAQKVLAVEGEIRNIRDHSQPLPDIELSLRDDTGREVYVWKTPAPKADLAQGETIQFRARLASPPEGAKVVRVNFTETEPVVVLK